MEKIILYSIFILILIFNIKSSISNSLQRGDYKNSLNKTSYYLSIVGAFIIVRLNLDLIIQYASVITNKYLSFSDGIREIIRVIALVVIYFIIQGILYQLLKLLLNLFFRKGRAGSSKKWSLVMISSIFGFIRSIMVAAFLVLSLVTGKNIIEKLSLDGALNNIGFTDKFNEVIQGNSQIPFLNKVNDFIPASNVIIYYNGVTLEQGIKSNEEIDKKAKSLVLESDTDIEKAKKLYVWIGNSINYDYNKAERALGNEEVGNSGAIEAWNSRTGICFDYACLYVAMARAVDLKVRLITGSAFDGVEFGPHAWNQIYSDEEQRWVNVDSTFYQGGNYFDTSNFIKEHIVDNIAGEW